MLAALGAGLVACGPPSVSTFPTATTLPDEPRRPDGVAVDRVPATPSAGTTASSTSHFVALRAPVGDDVALRLVERFFEAVVAEDTAALATLVSSSTTVHDLTPTGGRVQQAALQQWRGRFQKYDYLRLTTAAVYRQQDIRTYRGRDMAALPGDVQAAIVGNDGDLESLVVHVGILSPVVDNERLFGDELYFWLERQGDGFRIVKLAEDVPF